ncbi:hypothetical protein B0H12DRAFT_298586 [Mycena haematopus]|nr:hypothetical protein B0H12DRAFT_298586 [Mycena haematopus]
MNGPCLRSERYPPPKRQETGLRKALFLRHRIPLLLTTICTLVLQHFIHLAPTQTGTPHPNTWTRVPERTPAAWCAIERASEKVRARRRHQRHRRLFIYLLEILHSILRRDFHLRGRSRYANVRCPRQTPLNLRSAR